ncbi:Uncharacterised protein [Mycobacteroides abscessus]|nr:Uncharacterised protein [Mycobacteroides abscessus]
MPVDEGEHGVHARLLERSCERAGKVEAGTPPLLEHLGVRADALAGSFERRRRLHVGDPPRSHCVVDRLRDLVHPL